MAADDNHGGQYVTVGIGDEIFALSVSDVREVLDLCPFTKVPNMPQFMRGMIDVRGQGVPVVDMRAKFGLPSVEPTSHTRIVVLEIRIGGRQLTIGALTDRVYEVAEIGGAGLEPPPDFGVTWRSEFIRGIGRRGDAFVIILALDRLFATDSSVLAAETIAA